MLARLLCLAVETNVADPGLEYWDGSPVLGVVGGRARQPSPLGKTGHRCTASDEVRRIRASQFSS